jgi:ATP-dependent Clp protease adaptor protein ClpS
MKGASAPVEAPVEAPTKEPAREPIGVGEPAADEGAEPDVPWVVIVWNDPVNLMTYVTWVLQKLFGYPRAKAEKLMMDVHTKGKAVVASGSRDEAERDVARLHAYGLWATMQKDR